MNRLTRYLELPPRSFEAEQAVIRAILNNNQVLPEVRKRIEPRDFTYAAHEAIFRSILIMHDLGGLRRVNAQSVETTLKAREDFHEIGGAAAFAAILEGTPNLTRTALPSQTPSESLEDDEELTLCLADVEPSELRWLWNRRVPVGCLMVLAGPGGHGKSLVALDMASRVTTGTPFFDTPDVPNPQGTVVLVSAHDPIKTVVVPRLIAAGADRSRVRALQSKALGRLRLDDIAVLDKVVAERDDTRLLIIDAPLALAAGNRARQRLFMDPLAVLAETHQLAVVLVIQGAARTLGSVSWGNAVRAVWSVARDEGNETRFLLRPVKNNLAPRAPRLAYRIADDAPRIEWEVIDNSDGANRVPEYEYPSRRAGLHGPAPRKSSRDAEWLWALLQNGPLPFPQVVFAAQQAGILTGDSPTPLYNAKNRLPELHTGFEIEPFEAPHGTLGRACLHWKVVPANTFHNDAPVASTAQGESTPLRCLLGYSEPQSSQGVAIPSRNLGC